MKLQNYTIPHNQYNKKQLYSKLMCEIVDRSYWINASGRQLTTTANEYTVFEMVTVQLPAGHRIGDKV